MLLRIFIRTWLRNLWLLFQLISNHKTLRITQLAIIALEISIKCNKTLMQCRIKIPITKTEIVLLIAMDNQMLQWITINLEPKELLDKCQLTKWWLETKWCSSSNNKCSKIWFLTITRCNSNNHTVLTLIIISFKLITVSLSSGEIKRN